MTTTMPPDTAEPQLLDAREARAESRIKVNIGGNRFVWAKKLDMAAVVMSGAIPMPLLTAVEQMLRMPNATPTQRLAALEERDRVEMFQMLRKHALAVVLEPVLTETDDNEPSHLPIELLSLQQLVVIWTETQVGPAVGLVAAAEFRPPRERAAADVPPPVGDVSSTAEPVADGADVQYA